MNRRMFLGLGLAIPLGCTGRGANRVVVYCAQDREFAEAVFSQVADRISIVPKYDTEAQKSVSLYEEILRERERPRCDVFWNNEILNTIRLHRQGVLEPLELPVGDFPEWTRPPHRCWRAFSARMRVLIVNRQRVAPADVPRSLWELTQPKWRGQIAMAKPQFGTTATQAACLWTTIGPEATQQFYRGLAANQVNLMAGNKPVADAVADGRFAVGLTDTDDALAQAPAHVTIVFPDSVAALPQPKLGVLLIPNTVCRIKNGPNPQRAMDFIQHLFTAQAEATLAEKPGYHIPLGQPTPANHPLPHLGSFHQMAVDWEATADAWNDVQDFLRAEFAHA